MVSRTGSWCSTSGFRHAESCCTKHHVVGFDLHKEHCKACDSICKRSSTDAKEDLAKVRDAICALQELASADRSLIIRGVMDRNSAQDQLSITLVKLQIADRGAT